MPARTTNMSGGSPILLWNIGKTIPREIAETNAPKVSTKSSFLLFTIRDSNLSIRFLLSQPMMIP